MKLELGKIPIHDVKFDSESRIEGNTLYLNQEELISHLMVDENIKSITIDVARPGDKT